MVVADGVRNCSEQQHEFTRLEEAINRAASAQTKRGGTSSKQQEADLNKRLDTLFDKIDHSLGDLLVSLDRAIPSATLASDKSRRIFGTLRQEESQTERSLQERSWIEWMKEVKGAKGKQLRRDLDLTRGSAAAVIGVWEALEETRNGLLGYRNNVGHFKVSSTRCFSPSSTPLPTSTCSRRRASLATICRATTSVSRTR